MTEYRPAVKSPTESNELKKTHDKYKQNTFVLIKTRRHRNYSNNGKF